MLPSGVGRREGQAIPYGTGGQAVYRVPLGFALFIFARSSRAAFMSITPDCTTRKKIVSICFEAREKSKNKCQGKCAALALALAKGSILHCRFYQPALSAVAELGLCPRR